jgi:hypothetical protein
MKKKLILLLFTFHFSLFTLKAQDIIGSPVNNNSTLWSPDKDSSRLHHGFFSVDAGVSLPGSNFANTNLGSLFIRQGDSTHVVGYAYLGFNIHLTGGVFLTKTVGLIAKVSYSHNSFEQGILNADNANLQTATVSGNYNIWQFTGGVFKNFQFKNDQSVWIDLMAGCIDANYPQITITDTLSSYTFLVKNALNVNVQLSVGYEIMIFQGVGLIGTATYSFSELYYSPATYSYTWPVAENYTQSTPVHMNYGAVDLTIGMVFHL